MKFHQNNYFSINYDDLSTGLRTNYKQNTVHNKTQTCDFRKYFTRKLKHKHTRILSFIYIFVSKSN